MFPCVQGYTGYRGDLDVRSNSTGTHSYVAQFDGVEIMFHVSTELVDRSHDDDTATASAASSPGVPPADSDEIVLAKKRRIGNDLGVIIFQVRGVDVLRGLITRTATGRRHVYAADRVASAALVLRRHARVARRRAALPRRAVASRCRRVVLAAHRRTLLTLRCNTSVAAIVAVQTRQLSARCHAIAVSVTKGHACVCCVRMCSHSRIHAGLRAVEARTARRARDAIRAEARRARQTSRVDLHGG
jgi:hypothetical protein